MVSLTVPQVAATLAVALVAYSTKNASGERLIDGAMLNATVVLMIVSSLVGLIFTERAATHLKGSIVAPATPPLAPRSEESPSGEA